MNAKQAREFYLDYLNTIYTERKVDQLGRFFAPDIVVYPSRPGREPGLKGMLPATQAYVDAFSDLRMTLEGFVFEHDMMAPRIIMSGTQVGTFMGIPATGRRFQIIDHPHYQLRDGKIAVLWDNPDLRTMLQQLGATPTA